MIGETSFDLARQMRFAISSGDLNPIHVDPVAVRRRLPSRLVVHGVHILLWTLGVVARSCGDDLPAIARIRVRFRRFTYVDDVIRIEMRSRTSDEMRLSVMCGDVVRVELRIAFGSIAGRPAEMEPGETFSSETGPLDHTSSTIDDRHGHLPFILPIGAFAAQFPETVRWIGAQRIEALAAATRLVGMIYPGLNSVLGGIDITLTPPDGAGTLAFRMGELRHGQIDADISGGGIAGVLDCRTPKPPAVQLPSSALRPLVTPGRYEGAQVLVVGGSRGAGEVSAKLLGLGGAEVIITYRDGADDAAAVAADIMEAGGKCSVQCYDALRPATPQLGGLAPTHACWFATPLMVEQDTVLLDRRRLEDCQSILLSGFFDFASSLHGRRSTVRVLSPSMQWIDAPPPGLAEYVMMKAAAEVLAKCIEAAKPGMRVLTPRLPPIATDQTARMNITDPDAPGPVLLPHIDELIHQR